MSTSDSTILRVAVAGCHRQVTSKPGSHNWATAFAEVADTRVVAVYDRGADTRAEFRATWRSTWGEIAAYDDYGRMLAEVRPDIVCIATRQTHHSRQIVQAAAAGVRGILCDKPFVTSLTEADAALEACRKAGVAVAYGTEWRWDAAYRLLAERLRDGLVGEVRNYPGLRVAQPDFSRLPLVRHCVAVGRRCGTAVGQWARGPGS